MIGLAKGAIGDNVVALQNALNRVGIGVKYGVDGYFGSATQASVKPSRPTSTSRHRHRRRRHRGCPRLHVAEAPRAARQPAPAANAPAGERTGRQRPPGRSQRPAVAQLQRAITRIGWPARRRWRLRSPTPRHSTAVQRANGLPATGALDDATARLLRLSAATGHRPTSTPTVLHRPPPAAAPAPAASAGAGTAVAAAMSQLGVPYVPSPIRRAWPSTAPACRLTPGPRLASSLPHQSGMQSASTTPVAKEAAQPGDLLFFHAPSATSASTSATAR